MATVLTAAGKRQLEREFEHLREVKRPEIERVLRASAEDGEIDNAAYLDAHYQYGLVNARLERLARALNDAEVLADRRLTADGRAELGSRVTVVDDAGLHADYQLVSSLEADAAAGRISVESPVGRALLGMRAGAEVGVLTPATTVRLRVLGVR